MGSCGHWGFRRSRHTTPSFSTGIDSLIVTHPFHPLAGQRVAILFERRYKSATGRVYICDGGALGSFTVPESFTDRGAPPATRPLTADLLTALASAGSAVDTNLDSSKGRS